MIYEISGDDKQVLAIARQVTNWCKKLDVKLELKEVKDQKLRKAAEQCQNVKKNEAKPIEKPEKPEGRKQKDS